MKGVILAVVLSGLALGCDYGLEYSETASQGPAGSGAVVGVSRGVVEGTSRDQHSVEPSAEKGGQGEREGAPARIASPAFSVQGSEECLYLKGGHVVVVPCVLMSGADGRRHGDPDPWTPGPSGPADPVVDPY